MVFVFRHLDIVRFTNIHSAAQSYKYFLKNVKVAGVIHDFPGDSKEKNQSISLKHFTSLHKILQYYNLTILQSYNLSISKSYDLTIL